MSCIEVSGYVFSFQSIQLIQRANVGPSSGRHPLSQKENTGQEAGTITASEESELEPRVSVVLTGDELGIVPGLRRATPKVAVAGARETLTSPKPEAMLRSRHHALRARQVDSQKGEPLRNVLLCDDLLAYGRAGPGAAPQILLSWHDPVNDATASF